MFYRRQFARVFAVLLSALLALSAVVPAQQPTDAPAPSADETADGATTPQQQPTPPRRRDNDDITLQQDDEVERVEADLTNLFFTATDKSRRFVNTLKREDIRVLEDGVEQPLFTFQQNIDLPLTLAIVVDTSNSQEHTLPSEKDAARAFVDAVIRPQKDEVAVLTFTGETTLELGLTGNIQRVRRAIEKVEFVRPSGYIGGGVSVGLPGGAPGTPPISGDNPALAG
ncbi:MAG TPA: VWA domain-containing protein, partial [Pyrinomonadaceae bacterium]|nr:VWA domain-containing protein [Pyrinomonadaceae bacterium]